MRLQVTTGAAGNAGEAVAVTEAFWITNLPGSKDIGSFGGSLYVKPNGVSQILDLTVAIGRRLPALLRRDQAPINWSVIHARICSHRFSER